MTNEQIRNFEAAFQFFDWNKVARDRGYALSHFLDQALERLRADPGQDDLRRSLTVHLEKIRLALGDQEKTK